MSAPHPAPASAADPCWTLEQARRQLALLPAPAAAQLAGAGLERLGRGWDADAFLVGGEWVLRFPRHEDAAEGFERELVMMDWLAARLPLAVPQPVAAFAGPSGIPGWRFVMSRLIPGRPIADAGLDRRQRAALARPLGEFIAALHRLDPAAAPAGLPGDPYGRFDLERRLAKTRATLDQLTVAGELGAAKLAALRRLIEAGPPELPAPARPRVVHADLHRRNLLVGENGALTGAIDWVDLHQGERAADLYALFVVLPPEARADFLAAYGEVSAPELGRARWRAAVHMTLALQGSLERGDATFAASCRDALGEILEPRPGDRTFSG